MHSSGRFAEPKRGSRTGPATVPRDEFRQIGDSVGLDANLPVLSDGTLSDRVLKPEIIARSYAKWVRLNFVLGPWSSVWDETRHVRRTWHEAYSEIIQGYRRQGLQIYALIGAEAVSPADFRDIFRLPPPQDVATHTWIENYVDTFVSVLGMFQANIAVAESISEPDDYHGGTRHWVHPEWFAIILQRLYEEVDKYPDLVQVPLVSGPVQGLDANRNNGPRYLAATYQAGIRRFGWGKDSPFPFDSVGYHIYVEEGQKEWLVQKEAIRRKYERFFAELKQTIQTAEGSPTPICVSEAGWHSNGGNEELQKQSLPYGISLLYDDPWVVLAIAFCTQDFGPEGGNRYYGLYRQEGLTLWHRKPAYYSFKRLCSRLIPSGPVSPKMLPAGVTYGDIIDSLHVVSNALGHGDWGLASMAGVDTADFVKHRDVEFPGQTLEVLPALSNEEQRLLTDELDEIRGLHRPRGEGQPFSFKSH